MTERREAIPGPDAPAEALEGIRVLDLSRYGPGRYCSLRMAQLGAEVITIEDPRSAGSGFLGADSKGRWLVLNRGKKDITLNLKTGDGKQIFYKLAQKADVIIETFSPGVVRRLNVDYETVSKMNPGIVYCSISGYGQTGPRAAAPGHDINYIAQGGVLGLTGKPGEAPVIPGTQIADVGAALEALGSIVTALLFRTRSGRGSYIDISMLGSVLGFLWFHAARSYVENRSSLGRGEGFSYGSDPRYNVYRTRDDKYVALGCLEGRMWQNFCRAVGHAELAADMNPAELEEPMPASWQAAVMAALRAIFLGKTRQEWLDELGRQDISISPVNDIPESLSDLHLISQQAIITAQHPRLGPVMQLAFPAKFSAFKTDVRANSIPAFGQDTAEILQGLGYSQAEIARLREEGVIA